MAYQFSSAVSWGGGYNTGGDFSLYPDWFGKLSTSTTSYSGAASASYPPLSYNLKTETWGRTIPVSAGQRRLSGHYIWAKVSQNLSQEQQYDADGSATLDETSYLWNPLADIAVSFGYNGEPDATVSLTKLYFDGVEVVLSSLDYVFYGGTEAQTADPSIAADKGAANTPAFRGQIYIVIKQVDLSKFGNRFPAVSALVNGAASGTFAETEATGTGDIGVTTFQSALGADWSTGRFWFLTLGATSKIAEWTLDESAGTLTMTSLSDSIDPLPSFPLVRSHYVPWEDVFISQDRVDYYDLIAWTRSGTIAARLELGEVTVARDVRAQQFTPSVGATQTIVWLLNVRSSSNDKLGDHRVSVYTFDGSAFALVDATASRIDGLGPAPASTADEILLGRASSGLCFGQSSAGSSEAWMMLGANGAGSHKLNQLVRLTFDGTAITATAVGTPLDIGYDHEISGITYLADEDTIVVTWSDINTAALWENRKGGIAKFTRAGALSYQVDDMPPTLGMGTTSTLVYETRWGSFAPNDLIGNKLIFALDGFNSGGAAGNVPYFTVVDMTDGSYVNYPFADLASSATTHADYGSLWREFFDTSGSNERLFANIAIGDDSGEVNPAFAYYTFGSGSSSVSGTTLSGSIVGRATVLAELTASQITTVNLDDAITGWLVWENAEFKSHLTNDGSLFGFDYFESGTGIKCIRHVDGATFTVNRVLTDADLLLMENDTATISRIDEQDIPAIGKVNYIDPSVEYRVSSQRARRARYPIPAVNSNRTAEYTTSVIMDATTALSQCAKALFREDTGRVALTFMLKRTQLAVEVGNIVQLPAIDGKVFTVRIVEWILQPDFSMQCTGLVLLENEAITLNSSGGESFTYTNGAPRLMRSPFIRSTARVYPATIS